MTQASDDAPRPEGERASQGAPPPPKPASPESSSAPTTPGSDASAERPTSLAVPSDPELAGDGQDFTPTPGTPTRSGGRTAVLWTALICGAIVLILLLIFIIQNNVPTRFEYFTAQFQLPLGVAMLLAAIAGALVMALVGSVRMVQMSWTIRRMRKQQEKIHRATG